MHETSTQRTSSPDHVATRQELARRMNGPQRHRLLQGYPMVPLMRPVTDPDRVEAWPIDRSRPLIVGVLPHPFCNPSVSGCGFCTFPHEQYRGRDARAVTDRVVLEVEARAGRIEGLANRSVEALYFGGGTANLTAPDRFEALCRALARVFRLEGAEVTLEGVPVQFLARRAALLRILSEVLPGRHRRLSMGVQTFDPGQLQAMGRDRFGGRTRIGEVVEQAHALGMTVSGDFLVNLPGQSRDAMLDDVRSAIWLGFDQICVYHLVLYEGLGTAWSEDPDLLASLPAAEEALANWRAVRAFLLEQGYVQTTLTNFERAEVHATPQRFEYERCSFTPERFDGVGFGPSAISCFTEASGQRALKVINASGSRSYVGGIDRDGEAYALQFQYTPTDLKLLHLTRKLPLLEVNRLDYRQAFGSDLLDDFAEAFEALAAEGLVEIEAATVRLTPRGMFHADSVAGLLAWPRARALRQGGVGRRGRARRLPTNEAAPAFMG